MKTNEIRAKFLEYFETQNHQIVASSSLVPHNDPTLLFTNSGMVQFKDLFLGEEIRKYNRATTSQRCVRAGGKHNDLENVGYTARHHTFFEMLGNFSFGDYFKQDAIRFAWELLTQVFALPAERLWVTVFEDDDEANDIWVNQIGVAAEKVIRIGAKDNFWQMGDTGPCGPCSEIFYDHGAAVQGGPPGSPDEDGDRYVEIWNLVFMQFNRLADGTLEPLPKPSVDTGMGLERMATVLQGVHSNYEIDLFQTLINATADVLGIADRQNKSLHVIADHIRSTAFMIVDGVIPSNEGRGYVLRRIVRRAIRHAHQLKGQLKGQSGGQSGYRKSFMHLLVAPLVALMGDAFPELRKSADRVTRVLKQENENFNQTLEQGLKMLDSVIENLSGDVIPGETVFKLYDTYGFPADLTADVAREHNLSIDQAAFDSAMEAQRARARSASQFTQAEQLKVEGFEKTRFLGYQNLQAEVSVAALIKHGEQVACLSQGDDGMIVLNETPFYAESGGQVGDQGALMAGDSVFQVADTRYLGKKVIAHLGTVIKGEIAKNDAVIAEVSAVKRHACANNHSATHLLHAALKRVLGEHVEQKGSLVERDRLRFDFAHFAAVTVEQIKTVESLVNENIRANHEVSVVSMDLEEAKRAGAEALFGEKYASTVRTIKMGEFSFELCGGTHVARTGELGFFQILGESGVAAGVRRIEAVTALGAEMWVAEQSVLINDLTSILKSPPHNLAERVRALVDSEKQQQKQIQQLQTKLATTTDDGDKVKVINGIKVVAIRQDNTEVKAMRMAVDQWKQKLGSAVVLVAGANDGKVTLIAGVSHDLCSTLSAGDLIRTISPLVDGKGGGKAEIAQGGGTNASGINTVMEQVYQWVNDRTTG